jgi:hypothetical protein
VAKVVAGGETAWQEQPVVAVGGFGHFAIEQSDLDGRVRGQRVHGLTGGRWIRSSQGSSLASDPRT